MMNRAGAFVTPYATVFPFNQDELPASISSPDWDKLDLNTTGETAMPLAASESPFIHCWRPQCCAFINRIWKCKSVGPLIGTLD